MRKSADRNHYKIVRAQQNFSELEKEGTMKTMRQITKVKTVITHGLATQHPVKLIGILALGTLLLAGTGIQFAPDAVKGSVRGLSVEEAKSPSKSTHFGAVEDTPNTTKPNSPYLVLGNEASLWMRPWSKPQTPEPVVHREPQVRPWDEAGVSVEVRHAAQQELIELGFGTMEKEQFQASVAEADDAGRGELLRQAGFTEQQIRNAQERQRGTYEAAETDRFHRQLIPIYATYQLQRQGFADYRGNVNIASADDAGHRDLLLRAGFTELQIQDAQRRQRKAYEEAETEAFLESVPRLLGW